MPKTLVGEASTSATVASDPAVIAAHAQDQEAGRRLAAHVQACERLDRAVLTEEDALARRRLGRQLDDLRVQGDDLQAARRETTQALAAATTTARTAILTREAPRHCALVQDLDAALRQVETANAALLAHRGQVAVAVGPEALRTAWPAADFAIGPYAEVPGEPRSLISAWRRGLTEARWLP